MRIAIGMQVPAPLEIGVRIQAVDGREDLVLLGREESPHLVAIPDVELPLVTLAVRVQAGVVAATRVLHFPHHPVGGGLGGLPEQRFTGDLPSVAAKREQRPVVVEHLLEVRDHPALVHRVAAETAPELVVDAAFNHALQGLDRHAQGLVLRGAGRRRGGVVTKQQLQVGGVRELGRAAETAVAGVEALGELAHGGLDGLVVGDLGAPVPRGLDLTQGRHEGAVLLADGVLPLSVGALHALHQVGEGDQAVARLAWEVGAGEEGLVVVRGEKNGQGPAAGALGQKLVRGLVDLVQVRALLAIHLDVDE